jgi:hypothetical protein
VKLFSAVAVALLFRGDCFQGGLPRPSGISFRENCLALQGFLSERIASPFRARRNRINVFMGFSPIVFKKRLSQKI